MSTIQLAYQKPLKGKNVGVVFGTFAPLHQGHLDLIYQAKKENDAGCIVIVCGAAGDRGDRCGLPLSLRYQYVREFFKDDDLVAVYAIDDGVLGFKDDYSFDQWKPWIQEFDEIYARAVESSVRCNWYVGEEQYHNDLTALGYDSKLVVRSNNPISGTMIRENPLKYWDKIALPFRRTFSKNILIIGTASEGKTNLAMDLAKYFSTTYAREWPRDYMEKYCKMDHTLTAMDFATFLIGQHQHIAQMVESPANRGVCFVDSDAITTDMYAQHYADRRECALTNDDYNIYIDNLALYLASEIKWEKIFLLPPNGEFVDDHTRYMADASMQQRNRLYWRMRDTLDALELWDNVQVLCGDYYDNFKTVKAYVNNLHQGGESNA